MAATIDPLPIVDALLFWLAIAHSIDVLFHPLFNDAIPHNLLPAKFLSHQVPR